MEHRALIFCGGKVFDGTGSPAVPGDVVVRGDRVDAVLPAGTALVGPDCRAWSSPTAT
jgi:N-acyl-D-aspartate/D-glutamate deacylase